MNAFTFLSGTDGILQISICGRKLAPRSRVNHGSPTNDDQILKFLKTG
jgi:hypothetical protein